MAEFEENYFTDYSEQSFKWEFWAHYIKKHTNSNDSILAIGCAYGFLFKYLKNYKNAYGIDISEHAIVEAKKINPHVNFQTMDAEQLKFENKKFKLILCLDTLEHLPNPERCVKEMQRVLEQNGKVIITTPNPESISRRKKGLKWFAFQDSTHISIKRMKDWKKTLKENNFLIEKATTMDLFDFPYFNKLFLGINLLSYKVKYPFIPKVGDNTVIVAKKSNPIKL